MTALEVNIASPAPRERTSRTAAPALLVVSFAAIVTTQLLGPSATEPPLGAADRSATPPWFVHAAPSAWVVTGLLALAIAAGVVVLWLGITGRWRPDPRRALAAGVLAAAALSVLPPIGSADPLSYAADGRIAALGHNPWNETPAELAATGDPVGRAVEVPWQHTPSVYGPIATAEQDLTARIAGPDVALAVLILDLIGAAAFAGAGFLLVIVARTTAGKRRAAVMWAANPLLWLQLVAGAHLDVLAAVAALGAVLVAARNRLAAGALAGAAAAIKAPVGLVWLALVWAGRRSRRAVVELTIAAAVVAGTGYAVAGDSARHQLGRASRLVSLGTPWRPVADALEPALGHRAARELLGVLALVLLVFIAVTLARGHPDVRAGTPAGLAFAFTAAYVVSAPYALPWYDAVPWVLLPLLVASRLDGLLLAHTAVLSLAYIPGRAAVRLHGALHTVAFGMRDVCSPILLLAILVVLTVASRRHALRPAVLA
jgi:hypothetical protein